MQHHGFVVGHISPEAHVGGLLSIVKNGDIIFVIPQDISAQGTVSVTGSVKYPFEYPLEEYPSITDRNGRILYISNIDKLNI